LSPSLIVLIPGENFDSVSVFGRKSRMLSQACNNLDKRSLSRAILLLGRVACSLRLKPSMSIFIHSCDRCRDYFAGKSYHVSSEEKDGEKLLDMVVCYGCYIEAARLGLNAEAVDIGQVALH